MEKIKQYKYIILIILVILGFAFYWFQLRPTQIRSKCWDTVEKIKNGEIKSDNYLDKFFPTDNLYTNCLKEKGLEK